MKMDTDEKLQISKIQDLFTLCDKYCEPRFSDFLDGGEQAIIQDNVTFPCDFNIVSYGGFDDAEKKIIGVFPQWNEPDLSEFPMVCLKIEGGLTRKLTHRDYMGTILSLGITPNKLGDIVVNDGFAYVFLHNDIAEYVSQNLNKIGNQGVKVSVFSDFNSIHIQREYKIFGAVCSAPRLDAIVGAAANISRAQSSTLISNGKVKINHREITKVSEAVKEGDLLSIRGYGRFIVVSFDSLTRKNRMHITFKQYI